MHVTRQPAAPAIYSARPGLAASFVPSAVEQIRRRAIASLFHGWHGLGPRGHIMREINALLQSHRESDAGRKGWLPISEPPGARLFSWRTKFGGTC